MLTAAPAPTPQQQRRRVLPWVLLAAVLAMAVVSAVSTSVTLRRVPAAGNSSSSASVGAGVGGGGVAAGLRAPPRSALDPAPAAVPAMRMPWPLSTRAGPDAGEGVPFRSLARAARFNALPGSGRPARNVEGLPVVESAGGGGGGGACAQRIVVTAASHAFMSALTNLIASVQVWAPDARVVVYDLGLSATDLAALHTFCSVKAVRRLFAPPPPAPPPKAAPHMPLTPAQKVMARNAAAAAAEEAEARRAARVFGVDLDTVHGVDGLDSAQQQQPQQLPAHVQALGAFAWKPLVLEQVVREFGCALWLDAGVELHAPLTPLWHDLERDGYWVTTTGARFPNRFAPDLALKPWGLTRHDLTSGFDVAATYLGFVHASAAYTHVLVPVRQCALTPFCMCPPGVAVGASCDARGGEWRQDQSILNIVLWSRRHFAAPTHPWNRDRFTPPPDPVVGAATGPPSNASAVAVVASDVPDDSGWNWARRRAEAGILDARATLPPSEQKTELMQRVMRELELFAREQQSNVVVHLSPRYWSYASGDRDFLPQPLPAARVFEAEPAPMRLTLYARRRDGGAQYWSHMNSRCPAPPPLPTPLSRFHTIRSRLSQIADADLTAERILQLRSGL